MDLNTCYETTNYYHIIAYYSHLVPVVLGLFLGLYALYKTKFSKLAVVFFAFVFSFCLWLLGDLVTWTSQNYYHVYSNWSYLDYVNIVFFVLGAYFFSLLVSTKLSLIEKIFLILVCVPGFVVTVMGNSVVDFYHPVCEATNSDWLTDYKFWIQWVIILFMVVKGLMSWSGLERKNKIQAATVFLAMLLFFTVFGSTEYIASITGVYEINLYGLFVLPLFLIVMVFAVTNLGLFQFRLLSTQISAYVLLLLVGSQLIFIEGSDYRTLTLITLFAAMFIAYLLINNAKKEVEQRERIEKLAKELGEANDKLKELDQLKSEFLSLATHQIRSPLTAVKGYASLLLDGDYGKLDPKVREPVEVILQSTNNLVAIVGDFLDISRIEQGRMVYNKEVFDIYELARNTANNLMPNVEAAGLKLEVDISGDVHAKVNADKNKIGQIVGNLIDNAIKYTPKGEIRVSCTQDRGKVRVEVRDTGIGIDPSEVHKLFNKFSRTRDAHKTNVKGTGLGLYIAKKMLEAQGGTVSVYSKGQGKGSTFTIELPVV